MKTNEKKGYLSIVVILFLFVLFNDSCKKSLVEIPSVYAPKAIVLNEAKKWVSSQRTTLNTHLQKRLDSLLSITDWQSGIQTNVTKDRAIFYVPIKSTELGLVLYYDNIKMGFDSGNIVKVESNLNESNHTEILAIKTYYEAVVLKIKPSNSFSGTLHSYSLAAVFLFDYTFNNGAIISHGIVAPKAQKQTLRTNDVNTNSVTCVEWGYYLIWEYSPPTLLYTFLVCSGMPDCPPVSTLSIGINGGKQYVGVNCAPMPGFDGGTSGGGVGKSNLCNYTSESAQSMLSSFQAESIPFTGSLGFENEVVDTLTGYAEKDWKPMGGYWEFLRTTIIFNIKVSYGAYYGGKLFKEKKDDLWKYKSIQYLYSEKITGIVPPCFSLNVSVEDLGSKIDDDKRNANSTIHWNASLSISCLSGIEAGSPKQEKVTSSWGNPE